MKILKINKDFLIVILIILFTYVAWHGILNQTIAGEGFYYFSPTHTFFSPEGKMNDILHSFDNFPRLSTYILEQLFKGQMQPYMNAQFITLTLVFICIYIFFKFVTKNSLVALISITYVVFNYSGNFQFLARGHFQWFTQRVPEIIPILLSFGFLYLFVDRQKLSYYLLSISFFTLAILMTHYTTMFLAFYPAFMLSSSLFKAPNKILKAKFILLSIPFIAVNYLIVSGSSLSLDTIHPHQTLLESIIQTKDFLVKMSFQLVVVTIPYTFLALLGNATKLDLPILASKLIVPIYTFYMIVFIFLKKRGVPYFHLILAFFLALLGALYLNVYLNRIIVFNEIQQGRYYFIPGIYVGFILASFLYTLLFQTRLRQAFSYIILSILIALWAIPNTKLIWEKINQSQYAYTGGRAEMSYLNKIKSSLPPNSIVMLPNPLMPLGIDFLKKYYSGPNTQFEFLDSKWDSKIPSDFDLNKLFVFTYNDEYGFGGKARVNLIEIVDKSEQYRKEFREKSTLR